MSWPSAEMPFGARRDGRDGGVLGGEYVRGSRCFIDRRPAVTRGGGQNADRRIGRALGLRSGSHHDGVE